MRSAPGLRQVHGSLSVTLVAFALRRLRRARVAHLAVAFTRSSPSWSFRALRRSNRCSDRSRTLLSFHPLAIGATYPDFAASSEFCTPSTLHSATCLPALFRAGAVHGLLSFGGFSPSVAPRTSRSPVSSLSSSACADRLRGCQHRPDACRRFVGLALAALAPPLVVFPFEVLPSGLAPRFRVAPLMGFPGCLESIGLAASRPFGLSTCSSEFQRT